MRLRIQRPQWPTIVAVALCATVAVALAVGHVRERARLKARAIADTRVLADQLAAEFTRQLGDVEQALRAVDVAADAERLTSELRALAQANPLVVELLARRPDGRLVRAGGDGGAAPLDGLPDPGAGGASRITDLQPSTGAPYLVLVLRLDRPDGRWLLAARLVPDLLSDARLPALPPFGHWASVHDRSGRLVWRLPRLALTYAQRLPAGAAALPDAAAQRTSAGLDRKPRHESFVPVGRTGFVAVAGWRDDDRLADADLQERVGLLAGAGLLCAAFAVAAGRIRARQRA